LSPHAPGDIIERMTSVAPDENPPPFVPARVGRAGVLAAVVVVLCGALLLLPGLGRGVLRHGDEGRFAVAARETLAGGPWLVPTVLGEPLVFKPPLFIWVLVAAGKLAGGLDELAARLPVALSTLVAAAALAVLGAILGGPRAGVLAGLFFLTSVSAFWFSREILPDLPMTAASTVAVLAAALAWQDGRRWAALLFAAALAASFHFKLMAGLVPAVATVLAVAAIRRDLAPVRALRPALGGAAFALLLLPWLVRFLVVDRFASEVDTETLRGRAWDSWGKILESPPDAGWILVESLFPWSLLLPLAALHVWRRRSALRDDPVLIPLVWLGAAVGMNMLVNSVRWRYLIPALPPAALLVALAADAALAHPRGRLDRWLVLAPIAAVLVVSIVAGAIVLAGVEVGPIAGASQPRDLGRLPWLLVPILWAGGGLAGLAFLRRQAFASALLAASLVGLSLGSLEFLTRAERDRPVDPRPFAAEVRRIAAGGPLWFHADRKFLSHFHFYVDVPTTLLTEREAAEAISNGRPGYLVLPARDLARMERRGLIAAGQRPVAEGHFSRYDLVLIRTGTGP
jgi:4-amino-4-deoxy-L-arabinose transferase-like glycosyltransferase